MTEEHSVVVTVTFRGSGRFDKAEKLERAARRLGCAGTFSEEVYVQVDDTAKSDDHAAGKGRSDG